MEGDGDWDGLAWNEVVRLNRQFDVERRGRPKGILASGKRKERREDRHVRRTAGYPPTTIYPTDLTVRHPRLEARP